MNDDYDVDDLFDKPKKKKNSKNKGKRGELQLCKLLTERFNRPKKPHYDGVQNGLDGRPIIGPMPDPPRIFSRVVGSGNRWSQVEYVSNDYIGDIVTPPGFKFVIECKFGYSEINLTSILTRKCKQLDSFLKQSEKDAKRAGQLPLLCWKVERQPWMAFYHAKDAANINPFIYIKYGSWICTPLTTLLSLGDSYFFEGDSDYL